jgi:hypothetical protein
VRAFATLRFQLARAGRVRLTVFDVQGREVARVVDGERPAGMSEATLDARRLPRGVYHARLETESGTLNSRFVRLD